MILGGRASMAPLWMHIQLMSFCVLTPELLWQNFHHLYSSAHAFPEQEHHTETKFEREAGSSPRLENTPFPTS